MASFSNRLLLAVRERQTPALVGLDPRVGSLPAGLRPEVGAPATLVARAYETFCSSIVDVIASLVPAVKPQAAFFEQLGPPGVQALANVVRYARQAGLLVILDGKRGDIGSTAEAYADAYLGHDSPWGADALTVNPYLGADTLNPFVEACVEREAGIFVLVKTSNPGSGDLQDLWVDGQTVYARVAELVETESVARAKNEPFGPLGAVVGATYPDQLHELRAAMPHCWLLVPGFGAQGGTAGDVAGAFDAQGLGALVNSSRGIIFAYKRDEYAKRFGENRWQEAVEAATRQMIEVLATETAAGHLTSTPP